MKKVRPIDRELNTLIDELSFHSDRMGISLALKKFTQACGFERFAYVCTGGSEITGMSSYQQQWQTRYLEKNFASVDPVVRLARLNMQPFLWSRTDPGFQASQHRDFFDEAEEFGISSGLSIPVPASYGRFAMLTLASPEPKTAAMVAADPVRAITAAAFVHVCLAQLNNRKNEVRAPALSGRQLACLTWASLGKTMPETAILLGISPNTVRFYLAEAKDRLDAVNTAHAVRIAVERGLI